MLTARSSLPTGKAVKVLESSPSYKTGFNLGQRYRSEQSTIAIFLLLSAWSPEALGFVARLITTSIHEPINAISQGNVFGSRARLVFISSSIVLTLEAPRRTCSLLSRMFTIRLVSMRVVETGLFGGRSSLITRTKKLDCHVSHPLRATCALNTDQSVTSKLGHFS
jgi:hypothetical protein